jgi:hypothetical protein
VAVHDHESYSVKDKPSDFVGEKIKEEIRAQDQYVLRLRRQYGTRMGLELEPSISKFVICFQVYVLLNRIERQYEKRLLRMSVCQPYG